VTHRQTAKQIGKLEVKLTHHPGVSAVAIVRRLIYRHARAIEVFLY